MAISRRGESQIRQREDRPTLTYASTITSNINFFKAESKGYLYAEAKEAFSHKRLANCEVRITNEAEELIATFNGTGYRKDTELPFTPLV